MLLLALPVIAAANRLVDDPACRAAAARRTSPLARCMNLAPPFTGTRTVTNLMRLYGSPYVHHDHRITAASVAAADFEAPDLRPSAWLAPFAARKLPRPRCFVVSLRDPAARARSALNACRNGRNCFSRNKKRCVEFPLWNRSADDIFAAVFDESHPDHGSAKDGACFGVKASTTQYLAGLDCAAAEVHYLCTEKLEADFAALAAALGEPDRLASTTMNLHVKESNSTLHPQNAAYRDRIAPFYASDLGAAAKARARTALFPDDAALHAAYCGGAPD